MTKLELDAIQARCEAATPGTWGVCGSDVYRTHKSGHLDSVLFLTISGSYKATENANFVGHARQDIPALLAEVARLTHERDALLQDAKFNAGRETHANGCWKTCKSHRCTTCVDGHNWKWRGMQKEGDAP